ncbi:MAG: hypothetical protein ACR2PS_05975 [Pseudomonadales bacterium]
MDAKERAQLETDISLGYEASALMSNGLWKKILEGQALTLYEQWLATRPDATEVRERIHFQTKAIDDLVGQLQAHIDTGHYSKLQLDNLEAEERAKEYKK